MSKSDQYILFDGREEAYSLVLASNANIRSVCQVCTQAAFKSDDERLRYAREGDIPPAEFDGASPVYRFEQLYEPATYWAALAQQLFYGVPEMVRVEKGVVKITDQELLDKLNRSEVRQAFENFLSSFGATPYEVSSLLSLLASDRSRTILQNLTQKDLITPEPNTETLSSAGETASR